VSIYKRGAVYWARFGFNGQDVRQSLGTSDWQKAKRLERKLIVEAHEGKTAARKGLIRPTPIPS
jgi:hypothetical protein